MTKEEILNIYSKGQRITRNHTALTLNHFIHVFPEENVDVLQSVVDEYNSKIVLEYLGLSIAPNATIINTRFIRGTTAHLSENATQKVAEQINAKILFETLKRNKPITAENTFLTLEYMRRSYPELSIESLASAVEMYNSDIVLESLKQTSDITADTEMISPEILKYTFPRLKKGIESRVCDKYNALIYLEKLKKDIGMINAETGFVSTDELRKMYPELSDESRSYLENDFNSLVIFEREKTSGKLKNKLDLISAKDLGAEYSIASYEAILKAVDKCNSDIILQRLIHNQTPTVGGTLVLTDSLIRAYPNLSIECLEDATNAYNELILHEIMIADGLDVNVTAMKKNRIEVTPNVYKKVFSILKLGAIPVTLVIKNASELSCDDLEKMPSNVDRVVIRDGDSTPERGHQRMPYNRREYLEARKYIDEKILKDVQIPENSQDELSTFLKIFEAIANHVDEYDEYAITEKGKEDKRLEKTCRNLYGGLVQKRCVCAGFADILRNACACRNIDVKYIQGYEPKKDGEERMTGHAWNQVCINGNWFNTDLTWAIKQIKENGGKIPENMIVLCSDEQFSNHDSFNQLRTKSEKKCPLTLEEASNPSHGENGFNLGKLGRAIRLFAKDGGIRISEIRRIGDYLGKTLRISKNRDKKEEYEVQN